MAGLVGVVEGTFTEGGHTPEDLSEEAGLTRAVSFAEADPCQAEVFLAKDRSAEAVSFPAGNPVRAGRLTVPWSMGVCRLDPAGISVAGVSAEVPSARAVPSVAEPFMAVILRVSGRDFTERFLRGALFLLAVFICYKLLMEILSKSLVETEAVAKSVLEKLSPRENGAAVVALSGNLGAGKTAFTQSVARLLGVKEKITSPTFVLIKSYKLNVNGYKLLIHIDAYRLKSGEELLKLGWDEMISDRQNLILIEWAGNVSEVIPADAQKINFEFIDENTRRISLNAN